jgi:hypothetical protein
MQMADKQIVISDQPPQSFPGLVPKVGEKLWFVVIDNGSTYKISKLSIANADQWSETVDFTGGLGGSGDALTTVVVTTDQVVIPGTLYMASNPTILSLSLPTTAVDGDTFGFINTGPGTIRVTQSGSQMIIVGDTTTTTGVTGRVGSFVSGDWVEFVYRNSVWWATIKSGYVEVI